MALKKVEVTDLTTMFLVIDKEVDGTNMPLKQKPKWKKVLRRVAMEAHSLGKNGKVQMEVTHAG